MYSYKIQAWHQLQQPTSPSMATTKYRNAVTMEAWPQPCVQQNIPDVQVGIPGRGRRAAVAYLRRTLVAVPRLCFPAAPVPGERRSGREEGEGEGEWKRDVERRLAGVGIAGIYGRVLYLVPPLTSDGERREDFVRDGRHMIDGEEKRFGPNTTLMSRSNAGHSGMGCVGKSSASQY